MGYVLRSENAYHVGNTPSQTEGMFACSSCLMFKLFTLWNSGHRSAKAESTFTVGPNATNRRGGTPSPTYAFTFNIA
jgi:hypothetical protein